MDQCKSCGQPLRLACPVCGKLVQIENGKYISHESSTCTGSHMEYKSCSGSRKQVQP